jgi:hypothetical protein
MESTYVDPRGPHGVQRRRGKRRTWWKGLGTKSSDGAPMPPLPGRPDGLTCLGVLPGLLGPRAWPVGVETTFSNPLNNVQQLVEQRTPSGVDDVGFNGADNDDVVGVQGCEASLWTSIRFRMPASPSEHSSGSTFGSTSHSAGSSPHCSPATSPAWERVPETGEGPAQAVLWATGAGASTGGPDSLTSVLWM